jgi:hypothetical protein
MQRPPPPLRTRVVATPRLERAELYDSMIQRLDAAEAAVAAGRAKACDEL